MKLKRNVVMLPTNEASTNGLVINPTTNKIQYNDVLDKKGSKYYTAAGFTYNHLYITSDEEIKEDDYYILFTADPEIRKATSDIDNSSKLRAKIIASTDKSLCKLLEPYRDKFGDMRYNAFECLPSPSDGFIKKFIKRYNAGNPITEVMVEYLENCYQEEPDKLELYVDENNCITITSVKETWTREEVIAFAKKYANRAQATIKPEDEWIEQNL